MSGGSPAEKFLSLLEQKSEIEWIEGGKRNSLTFSAMQEAVKDTNSFLAPSRTLRCAA